MSTKAEEDHNWRTSWLRGGRIVDLAWIGRDVLAWCSGLHVVFLDVQAAAAANVARLSKFAPSDVSAQAGIACLSGHSSRRIFAFADKNRGPKIFVHSYPSLARVSECVDGTSNAYLTTALAGDYLVSLGSMPDFKLTVWFWRDGTKIGEIETGLPDVGDEGQILRLSISMPLFAAQLGKSSGRLLIWEMTMCSDTAVLGKTEIHLPRRALAKDVAWCPEQNDLLAIADRDGHIYLTNPSGSELKRVVLSQRCGICVDIEPAALCWYQGGIALRTTFCQIRYYQKDSAGVWRKVWFVKNYCWPTVITSFPHRDDRLFFATREGHVKQITFAENAAKPVAEDRYFNGGMYGFVDLLRPWEDHLVAIDASMKLSVIETRTGAMVTESDLDVEGKIKTMKSHLDYPVVVVSSDKGEVLFVSLIEYHKPTTLVKYKLQSAGLDFMKFSSTGSYLIVGDKESGIFYVLSVSVNERAIDVVARLDSGTRICDLVLFDAQDNLKLYILARSSSVVPIGYKLLHYSLASGRHEFTRAPGATYFDKFHSKFQYASRDSYSFVCAPYLARHLRFYTITDWKNVACTDMASSGHNLRCVKVLTDRRWLVVCSLDGSVTVRDMSKKHPHRHLHFMTHHKSDFGVAKAVVNSAGDSLVALGADGSLIGVRHPTDDQIPEEDGRFKNLLRFARASVEDHESQVVVYQKALNEKTIKLLSEPVATYASREEYKDLTWVEWQKRLRLEEERKRFKQKREKLLSQFQATRSHLVELLDKNEGGFDYERLPLSLFALNKNYREKRMKSAKDERAEAYHEVEMKSVELERVSDWIQGTFWNSQRVLAQSVLGIFDNTEVTNYAMPVEEVDQSDKFVYAQFARKVANKLLNREAIFPWDDAETRKSKIKSMQLKKLDEEEEVGLEQLISIDEEPQLDEESELNKYILEGLTHREFIEPCGEYFSQYEIYAFSQIAYDMCNIVEDRKRLRLFFNEKFDEIFTMKEREMTLVRERIDRIIHIGSELYTMFDELITENFVYPDWHLREQPELIIQVKDSEMQAKPYISPSKQELIDRKAAEEERRRQAMLADDFLERALQDMMDGKLEVRWEDIIKRDPPKPEFMLSDRDPESYTDEENFAVKRYEQELKNLVAERERYKRLLHLELGKTVNDLRESIDKFNLRLQDFHSTKLKVEAAIQQLNLRYVRYTVAHVNRVIEIKTEDRVKVRIEHTYRLISSVNEKVKVIQAVEEQLLQRYDALSVKDKQMEKRLKNEFPTLTKGALAAITSQYKKRPRHALKTKSPSEVLDLAKTIKSVVERPAYLTSECLDFLKQLEALEVRPATLSQAIEDSHWESLVALRRLKIDHELKQHAVSLELAIAAAALEECNRQLTEHRASANAMRQQLKDARKARDERELNVEVQLVLKMGRMEIPELRGDIANDWKNAVVVPRADLDRVNEAISIAGRKKIRTIARNLEFRKTIMAEQWVHESLRTSVRHLGADLYFVRSASATKGIREFLRRVTKGVKDDTTPQKMEREMETTRRGQILKGWEIKLEEVCVEAAKVRKKNEKLDRKVVKLNVDRCDMELKRDVEGEVRQKNYREKLVKMAAQRSAIIRKLLAEYEELLKLRQKRDSIVCVGKPLPK